MYKNETANLMTDGGASRASVDELRRWLTHATANVTLSVLREGLGWLGWGSSAGGIRKTSRRGSHGNGFFRMRSPNRQGRPTSAWILKGGSPGKHRGRRRALFILSSVYAEDDHHPIGFLPALSDARMEDILVTSEAVGHMLNRLPPNSPPGPDGIHPAMLRILAGILAGSLARLFHTSLRQNKIPTDWRLANITPIFKKGNRREVGNYRPVSLTSVVSKLLERIVRE